MPEYRDESEMVEGPSLLGTVGMVLVFNLFAAAIWYSPFGIFEAFEGTFLHLTMTTKYMELSGSGEESDS